MEEKGSDVNLAVYQLNDSRMNLFEAAVVVSNDTDFLVPIRMVAEERQRPVSVVCPGRWQIAPQLRQVTSHVRHVRPAMLRAAQLPDSIPDTDIRKPEHWQPDRHDADHRQEASRRHGLQDLSRTLPGDRRAEGTLKDVPAAPARLFRPDRDRWMLLGQVHEVKGTPTWPNHSSVRVRATKRIETSM